MYRKHYDNIDTDVISQNALSRVMREFNDIDDSCLNNKLVVAYAKESANLAWQMVIQQPPMCLSVQDTKFNDDYHKLWWSCDQSRASEIEFFVWPALYDYKNGNLLIKGCVFTNWTDTNPNLPTLISSMLYVAKTKIHIKLCGLFCILDHHRKHHITRLLLLQLFGIF